VELGDGKPKNPQAKIAELVRDARRLLLDNHWDLVLLGMVRANHPWRVTVKLSRALVAALGTAA
jgi:hypothetical protein